MPKGNCSCRNIVLITVFSTATKDLLFIILEYSIQNKMVYMYLIIKEVHTWSFESITFPEYLDFVNLVIWDCIYHKYVLKTNSLIFLIVDFLLEFKYELLQKT